jgi:hypothetical protein
MKISVEARSQAPPEILYATHMDIAHWPDFINGIDKVELLSEGPVGVGTKLRETRTMLGRPATEVMTIAALDPPRRTILTADSHGAHYVTTVAFLPDGSGSRVIFDFEATPQTFAARVMSLFTVFFVSGLRKMLRSDVEDLVREAERRARKAPA